MPVSFGARYYADMPVPIDRQAFLNLCDMPIANKYELEAIGELLEQKGPITKQEILSLAKNRALGFRILSSHIPFIPEILYRGSLRDA